MYSGVAREYYDGPSYGGQVIEKWHHRYRWSRELNLGYPVSGQYSWLGSPMQTYIGTLWRDESYTDVIFRGRHSRKALTCLFTNGHKRIKILINYKLLPAPIFKANEYWRRSVGHSSKAPRKASKNIILEGLHADVQILPLRLSQ